MIRPLANPAAIVQFSTAESLWRATFVLALAGTWAALGLAQGAQPSSVAPIATASATAATVAPSVKPAVATTAALAARPSVIAPTKPVAPVKPAALAVTAKPEAKPLWGELNPLQQESLKPLAGNWSTIGEGQKRKWLAISQNYQSLPPAEKAKMHSRMAEWSSLSQQQRAQARLNFAEAKSLSPDEKTAQWKAYQALSADEKQKLVAQAPIKPNTAAVAVKPVAPQKMAPVSVTRKTESLTPEAAAKVRSVNPNTLLPHATHPAVSKAPADTASKSQ